MQKYQQMLIGLLMALFMTVLAIGQSSNNAENNAVLNFRILDSKTGQPIPGKLIFLKNNKEIDLGIPDQKFLAPEKNGFYTANGKGQVSIPVGEYTVYACRGMEYSIEKKKVEIKQSENSITWSIKREFNPPGYVASAFHMHTLNSDGNCTEEERVTSLIGGGLEFAASSDHNYVSDFTDAVEAMQANEYITTCPGNELTTDRGHYNIYPLPPETEASVHDPEDARVLFGHARDVQNSNIIQANHPRMGGLDYFGHYEVDPLSGVAEDPTFSWDFDAVEVMNGAVGWGITTNEKNYYPVWYDWFNFFNMGFNVTGVGNTDSHNLFGQPMGWPRNYIASSTDDPAEIDVREITKNIKENKVSVSRGVYTNLVINKNGKIGSEIVDKDGKIKVKLKALSPSWAKFEQVSLYANGRKIWSKNIEPTSKFKKTLKLRPENDTWYVFRAEGNSGLWPIVPKQHGYDVTPLGFTNPVWVDIDGNGFETEKDRALDFINKYSDDIDTFNAQLESKDIWFIRQLLGHVEKGGELELSLLKGLLRYEDKFIRKFTFLRLAKLKTPEAQKYLSSIKSDIEDKNVRLLVEAMTSQDAPFQKKVSILRQSWDMKNEQFRKRITKMLSPHKYQTQWHIVGPFDNPESDGLYIEYPPEKKIDLDKSYLGKDNKEISWQKIKGEENGLIDFIKFFDDTRYSVVYAYVNIPSDQELETAIIFGSDDGSAVWHNGKELYRDFARRSAIPHNEIIPLTLNKGDNKFLVKVENGTSGWGLYFQLLTP
jgi:hypothetical protein